MSLRLFTIEDWNAGKREAVTRDGQTVPFIMLCGEYFKGIFGFGNFGMWNKFGLFTETMSPEEHPNDLMIDEPDEIITTWRNEYKDQSTEFGPNREWVESMAKPNRIALSERICNRTTGELKYIVHKV